MTVHSELNWGLLEAVYQEALHLELLDRGIDNQREKEIDVYYKKRLLDKKYKMDIVVDDIIIELKSVTSLAPVHRAQLCNYLRLTRKPLGLLINFGEESLIGERWAYDADTNECFIVDRNMQPISDADYSYLLDTDDTNDN
jgi:GxxExxY protein